MPLRSGMYAAPSVVIAANGTKSAPIAFADFTRGIFILPASFTGVAATFEVSADGETFVAFNDTSGAVSITVAQGKAYALPAGLAAALWIKIVSGSTEGTARTIQLMLKY